MKKEYMNPELEVVKIETNKNLLIATSDTEAASDAEVFAPGQREELEIFLFQLFLRILFQQIIRKLVIFILNLFQQL